MSNKIHESLKQLAVDVDKLVPLEGNPRKGNVQSIMASYKEFGQIKPMKQEDKKFSQHLFHKILIDF